MVQKLNSAKNSHSAHFKPEKTQAVDEVETKKSQEISRENELRRLQRQLREASEAANDTETKDGMAFLGQRGGY